MPSLRTFTQVTGFGKAFYGSFESQSGAAAVKV
jgi:hypothetical protein